MEETLALYEELVGLDVHLDIVEWHYFKIKLFPFLQTIFLLISIVQLTMDTDSWFYFFLKYINIYTILLCISHILFYSFSTGFMNPIVSEWFRSDIK